MSRSKFFIAVFIIIDVILGFYILLHGKNFQILNPQGVTSEGERNLILTAGLLAVCALIPVFGLTIYIVWKYRSGNTKSKYDPHDTHGVGSQLLWWAFPATFVLIFALITWGAVHKLDPYSKIYSQKKPLIIEVVALRWKWLFLYPAQNIATLNYIQFPKNTSVTFLLTADAPMNSFWIPQLSGQIYAMAGMSTQLNVEAKKEGTYRGTAAEINGKGFSNMQFTTRVSSDTDFESWVRSVQASNHMLTFTSYTALAEPKEDTTTQDFSSVENGLYDKILMKYTAPPGRSETQGTHMQ